MSFPPFLSGSTPDLFTAVLGFFKPLFLRTDSCPLEVTYCWPLSVLHAFIPKMTRELLPSLTSSPHSWPSHLSGPGPRQGRVHVLRLSSGSGHCLPPPSPSIPGCGGKMRICRRSGSIDSDTSLRILGQPSFFTLRFLHVQKDQG